MHRNVLDANVLAPGFIATAGAAAELIDLWRGHHYELVVSEHILSELRRTYDDTYYRRKVRVGHADRVDRLLRQRAVLIDVTVEVVGIATQPEDDAVLATALSANAVHLASRDKQLLKLDGYAGLRILHPSDLVDILRGE